MQPTWGGTFAATMGGHCAATMGRHMCSHHGGARVQPANMWGHACNNQLLLALCAACAWGRARAYLAYVDFGFELTQGGQLIGP